MQLSHEYIKLVIILLCFVIIGYVLFILYKDFSDLRRDVMGIYDRIDAEGELEGEITEGELDHFHINMDGVDEELDLNFKEIDLDVPEEPKIQEIIEAEPPVISEEIVNLTKVSKKKGSKKSKKSEETTALPPP